MGILYQSEDVAEGVFEGGDFNAAADFGDGFVFCGAELAEACGRGFSVLDTPIGDLVSSPLDA